MSEKLTENLPGLDVKQSDLFDNYLNPRGFGWNFDEYYYKFNMFLN